MSTEMHATNSFLKERLYWRTSCERRSSYVVPHRFKMLSMGIIAAFAVSGQAVMRWNDSNIGMD